MSKISAAKLGLRVDLTCNLKCKLCAAYAPYYKAYHQPIDLLKKSIDRYFEIVEHVGLFTLTGGEPLLRTDLSEVVKKAFEYERHIDRFEIITNGTIIPPDALLEALALFGKKAEIVVDNYGADKSVHAQKVFEKFQSLKSARVRLRDYYSSECHCDGWVNLEIEPTRKPKSEQEARLLYSKCAYPQKLKCNTLYNGNISACCPPLSRCIDLGLVRKTPDECFNIFDDNMTIEEMQEHLAGFETKNILSACAFCNGFCEDSPRYLPAEQL